MERFSPVVLACDGDMLRQAMAVRAVLEQFGLRIHFYHLIQKRHLLDFLAGDRVRSDYTVLCCHGICIEEDGPHLLLNVIEQALPENPQDGEDGEWHPVPLRITPAWLAKHLKRGYGTFISTGCSTGQQEMAEAFLNAGYSAYIGCANDIDAGSGTLFVLSFFHHLLAGERDWPTETYNDEEAVERARFIDSEAIRWGTNGFRYFTR
jgi:hypothetical protein